RAQSISSENLGERIPQPGTHDEIDRMVATLNEMIQRLEQSFAQLEQFTANASHELRTPLTILKGEIEVALQQSRNDGEYRSVLESNLEEVRRISRTVEHLFLLARIDANAITPVREPVFLKPLLEEIAKDAAILAGEHEVRIESALDDIPEAQGDTIMLVQLFINLVENGIKYNRPGGSLRLKLTAHGANAATGYPGIARVEVSDTGIGIPHEELDSIFDRFYRVDKQRARSHGGAGLGLSIAQWIVRMHKGSINVRSREGEGTTFTVDIPIE
ncbi:MAG: HAMP domain-containing protein, partial [Bacteroidetes bacterium]|nr:HAMP domain-containing protein [Bacteroidota bacterium]